MSNPPLAENEHTYHFTVRVPASLHDRITESAERNPANPGGKLGTEARLLIVEALERRREQ